MFFACRNPCFSPANGRYATGIPLARSASTLVFSRFGGDYFIFETLKEDHRTSQLLGKVNRRPLNIDIALFGIRSHESIQIPRLKFVRLLRQGLRIADAVVTGAGAKCFAESKRTKRRIT